MLCYVICHENTSLIEDSIAGKADEASSGENDTYICVSFV